MSPYGWDEVGKQRKGDSRFIILGDGDTVRLRLLDEVPYTFFQHRISQPDFENEGEEIFITVPATDKADEDYIDARTNRYPAEPRHAIRAAVLDDDGEVEAIKVLVGGVQIFRPLKRFYQKHGSVTGYDVEVHRDGEGLRTSYEVDPAVDSFEVDVEDLAAQVEEDESLEFEKLFPTATPEEQEKMIEEAGIDLDWDPVAEIIEDMTVDEALETHVDFGQYGKEHYPPKGKTVREILAIDAGWIEWAAREVTSDNYVAAACRMAVNNMEAIERPKGKKGKQKKIKGKTSKKQQEEPEPEPEDQEPEDLPTRDDWDFKSTVEAYLARWYENNGKKVPLALQILEGEGKEWDPVAGEAVEIGSASEPSEDEDEPEGDMSRDELLRAITDVFAEDEETWGDAMEVVKVIKKHGDGKTRIKDLKVEQLESLYDDIN